MLNRIYTLRMSENDLGQMIDALEARAVAWERTAAYHHTGITTSGFVVEECDDADEADSLARRYREIMESLTHQRDAQP